MIPVKENDLFDLASVSKISGGLQAWLKLYDDGKVNPDEFVSTLKSRGTYVYSDLPFVMTPKITSGISGISFIEPLGAYRITYNPDQKFTDDELIPTEKDNYYRKQQLLGTVKICYIRTH